MDAHLSTHHSGIRADGYWGSPDAQKKHWNRFGSGDNFPVALRSPDPDLSRRYARLKKNSTTEKKKGVQEKPSLADPKHRRAPSMPLQGAAELLSSPRVIRGLGCLEGVRSGDLEIAHPITADAGGEQKSELSALTLEERLAIWSVTQAIFEDVHAVLGLLEARSAQCSLRRSTARTTARTANGLQANISSILSEVDHCWSHAEAANACIDSINECDLPAEKVVKDRKMHMKQRLQRTFEQLRLEKQELKTAQQRGYEPEGATDAETSTCNSVAEGLSPRSDSGSPILSLLEFGDEHRAQHIEEFVNRSPLATVASPLELNQSKARELDRKLRQEIGFHVTRMPPASPRAEEKMPEQVPPQEPNKSPPATEGNFKFEGTK